MALDNVKAPKEFQYLAWCLYGDMLDEHDNLPDIFKSMIPDYMIRVEMQIILDFVVDVLSRNPTDDDLNALWEAGGVIVRLQNHGGRLAFESIRDVCADILSKPPAPRL